MKIWLAIGVAAVVPMIYALTQRNFWAAGAIAFNEVVLLTSLPERKR